MDETKGERGDGSDPERGTGQRQDHRAAPPGHEVPSEADDRDVEAEDRPEEEQEGSRRESS